METTKYMKHTGLKSAQPLPAKFFDKRSVELAPTLLGKVLVRMLPDGRTISCMITESEAYEYTDKASHSHRGRKGCEAMFDKAGTIYMYKIRQWHSLNISSADYGGGVLIKGACPLEALSQANREQITKAPSKVRIKAGIQTTNQSPIIPIKKDIKHPVGKSRLNRDFSGQGKLCQQLQLKTPEWNGRQFNQQFYIGDLGYIPKRFLVTPRLGVTSDHDRPYRFVDADLLAYATHPSSKRTWGNQVKTFPTQKAASAYAYNYNDGLNK